MLYDPSTSLALQAWLVKTLEPICDAEPEALATYVLALLKHDVQEHDLREELRKQLDEFFENGASAFVDTLFAALRSKSYIPYTTVSASFPSSSGSSQDSGIPIPLDALLSPSPTSPERGTKRAHDGDDREARGPPKGPRLSNQAYVSRQSNGNGADNWQRGPTDGYIGDMMNGGMPNNVPQGPRVMLPKGVCRDYHLKGFCSRGAMCKYTHDEGAFATQIPLPMNGGGMPFMGMYGGMPFPGAPAQPTAYDPNDPRMDMRQRPPYQRGLTMPQSHNNADAGQMFQGHGESPVIQDLTPTRPPENTSAMDATPTPNHTDAPGAPPTSTTGDVQMRSGAPEALQNNHGRVPPQPNGRPQRGTNPAFRGRGRGGRGTFTGDHQSFNGNENGRNSKTIVVEKLPDDKLSLEAVNSWFKRYGTVTNVAVDAPGKKALISYSSHEEARAAWSAEEAVFNNRFVKIFWHRPMEGQGTAGVRALQASAPLVANISARVNAPAPAVAEARKSPVTSGPVVAPKLSQLTALQEKQQLLEKQITEQKELMGKLAAASADEKRDIMARLRKLNEEMKTPSKPTPPPTSRTTSTGSEDKVTKQLLDMELEVHSKTGEDGAPVESEETRESLQEKLARLRAEASALGITDVSPQPYQPSYRGFRGRGRGRASFRGALRGGPPRASMKLDNRPKALLVKGVSSQDPEVVQAVRSWFETGGQLASLDVHDDESLVALFHSRPAAEQALSKGPNIPSAGAVKLSWHVENAPPKVSSVASQDVSQKKPAAPNEDRPLSPRPEETVEEIGWGAEDDDGMGMGGLF